MPELKNTVLNLATLREDSPQKIVLLHKRKATSHGILNQDVLSQWRECSPGACLVVEWPGGFEFYEWRIPYAPACRRIWDSKTNFSGRTQNYWHQQPI